MANYKTLETFMNDCSNSAFKCGVSHVIAANKHMTWKFDSAVEINGALQARLISKIEDQEFLLSCVLDSRGFHGHISALDSAPATVLGKLNT